MTTNARTTETLAESRVPWRVARLGIDRSRGGAVMDKDTWRRAVLALHGWRRYRRKSSPQRLRDIVARNKREMAQGSTPLPPVGEDVWMRSAQEYCGRNYIDPDMLDWATVEAYLATTELPKRFPYWLRTRPQSEIFIRGWRGRFPQYADEIEAMFLAIGGPHTLD